MVHRGNFIRIGNDDPVTGGRLESGECVIEVAGFGTG
jgi:hypothetical protein